MVLLHHVRNTETKPAARFCEHRTAYYLDLDRFKSFPDAHNRIPRRKLSDQKPALRLCANCSAGLAISNWSCFAVLSIRVIASIIVNSFSRCRIHFLDCKRNSSLQRPLSRRNNKFYYFESFVEEQIILVREINYIINYKNYISYYIIFLDILWSLIIFPILCYTLL